MRRLLYFLPVLVLGGLALFFIRGLQIDPHVIPSVLINQPAPAMDLAPLPGHKGLTTADLKGQVSLVNVFGAWCVACAEEHATLVQISKTGVLPIFGIDWRDDPEKGAAWLKEHGDPYARVGMDPAPSYTAVNFGVTGAPESFIVDRHGVIRYKYIGPITPDVWDATLLPIVRELQK